MSGDQPELNDEFPCKACGKNVLVDDVRCNGVVDGNIDLLVDCSWCGATLNAFLPVSDLAVLS